jgi:exopolysaccharide biosynthesis predicted pyruvyltransferase EpsI
MRCAQTISKKLGNKLIELHYHRQPNMAGHNQVAHIGPSEFLWYMKHAKFVITNSFHGTIFSILNKKPFYSIYKSGQNTRIETILTHLEIADRHIENEEQININNEINYNTVMEKLELLRTSSVNFLTEALR